jgi:hypothetical protein
MEVTAFWDTAPYVSYNQTDVSEVLTASNIRVTHHWSASTRQHGQYPTRLSVILTLAVVEILNLTCAQISSLITTFLAFLTSMTLKCIKT